MGKTKGQGHGFQTLFFLITEMALLLKTTSLSPCFSARMARLLETTFLSVFLSFYIIIYTYFIENLPGR